VYNVHQIWVSGTPSTEIIGYMESVADALGENDTYTLVADNNFLSHKKGVMFEGVGSVIAAFQADFPGVTSYWKSLIVEHKSDLLRYYMASITERLFYLDCDCEVLALPEPVSPYPHFAKATLSGLVVIDHLCFNNSKLGFFKILTQRLVDFMGSSQFVGQYGASFKQLNKQLRMQEQAFSTFNNDRVVHHT